MKEREINIVSKSFPKKFQQRNEKPNRLRLFERHNIFIHSLSLSLTTNFIHKFIHLVKYPEILRANIF